MNERALLEQFIKNIHPLPNIVAGEIANNFEIVYFKKDDLILKQGKVCDQYIFLESGFVRAFTFDTNNTEVTTNFYIPQSIVFEVASFFKRASSQENIQALTDCIGWKINFQKLNYLFHEVQGFREFGRAILVNGFI